MSLPLPFFRRSRSAQDAVVVLDAGTTAVKAFIFDREENVLAFAAEAVAKSFPQPGFVEQDPLNYLDTARRVLQKALKQSRLKASDLKAVGIANQRETVIAWQRDSGQPLYPAIVWEDTRTAEASAQDEAAFGKRLRGLTGLKADPYFTASKIRWLLQNVPAVGVAFDKNNLAFGTIDSWLLWHLGSNHQHLTDQTNASRTLLFNVLTRTWDSELLSIFGVPADTLPAILPSCADFGLLDPAIFGAPVSIKAICGDQQASMFAAGSEPGTTKVTYGTGTFIMQILGPDFVLQDPFFTTVMPNFVSPFSPDGEKGRMRGENVATAYVLEYKIARGAREVDPLLKDKSRLKDFLYDLAREVDVYLKKLPVKPQELTIDGGVSRDGLITGIQAEVSGWQVKRQPIFDGTALGLCRLLQAS